MWPYLQLQNAVKDMAPPADLFPDSHYPDCMRPFLSEARSLALKQGPTEDSEGLPFRSEAFANLQTALISLKMLFLVTPRAGKVKIKWDETKELKTLFGLAPKMMKDPVVLFVINILETLTGKEGARPFVIVDPAVPVRRVKISTTPKGYVEVPATSATFHVWIGFKEAEEAA